MAPPNHLGRRVKLVQVKRPFVYGTTAREFHPQRNPKPPGTPENHTHVWDVFVRGVDDGDITYWLKRVQFKLHESIPNHIRMVDAEPGKPFQVRETGWGEFDITLKLYYVAESGEKPQTLYHYLRLHPYGRTEEERLEMASNSAGEIRSWSYDEQLFNEPYESFFHTLTSGAHPRGRAGATTPASAGGKGRSRAGTTSSAAAAVPLHALPDPAAPPSEPWERTAMIPLLSRAGQPFSLEIEDLEVRKLLKALAETEALTATVSASLRDREDRLARLRVENHTASVTPTPVLGNGSKKTPRIAA